MDTLQPENIPETVVDREQKQSAIEDALSSGGGQHLSIYGPRGSGKTLLARTVLEQLPSDITTCYVDCTRSDTQYEALKRIFYALTGHEPASGYHTAQLQHAIEGELPDHETVIVLDEIDFLLQNDGDDLLYYLSRSQPNTSLTIVTISSNTPDISTSLDERTYSSLRPLQLTFQSYSPSQIEDILKNRLTTASLLDRVDEEALATISSATSNVQLALHWLEFATAAAPYRITDDLVQDVRHAAVQRYWDILLKNFSIHHHLLLEAVCQLVPEHEECVNTGPVYDRYTELCNSTDNDPLSHRRISDFLDHLELLGIIHIDHRRGGKQGKTREIQLNKPI